MTVSLQQRYAPEGRCFGCGPAGWHLMRRDGAASPPLTVTAEYTVKLRWPTPTDRPVRLTAKVASSDGPRVTVEAAITSDGEVTATFSGRFVAVGPDHPAARHDLGPYSGPPASGRPSAGRQGSTG